MSIRRPARCDLTILSLPDDRSIRVGVRLASEHHIGTLLDCHVLWTLNDPWLLCVCTVDSEKV